MDFGTLTLYRRGEQPQPFRLRLGSLSIGNDPAADISIEDSLLERFHARVVCTPAGCQLADLGSKNGTLVNKERLPAHAPRLLRDGDRIQLGRVGLLYAAPRPAAPPRPPDEPRRDAAPSDRGADAPARAGSGAERTGAEAGPDARGSGTTDSGAERTGAEAGPDARGSAPADLGSDHTVTGSDHTVTGSETSATGSAPAAQDGIRNDPARGRNDQGDERNRPAGGAAAPGPQRSSGATATVAPPERPAPAVDPADDWNLLFQVPAAPAPGEGATLLPGNRRRRRGARDERELPYEAEDYLALLPPIYHDDRFMRQLLLIFKSVLDPLDRQIAQIYHYFDPRTAPEQLLPWLAAWVDLALDERWPEARRRELIGAASTLYRWRGTRRGLSDYLRIYTGVTPRIVEQGQERRGEPAVAPHTFRVIIELPDPAAVDRALVERIIEQEKPAHAAYELELKTKGEG
ncbi:MAG TPA: phage tail protein I [Chloroflexaceae bacterium]|nr:phage tail protein I [Chloroflexaceae bacterium]